MAVYFDIDKKDYEESWPQVSRVYVKTVFHKSMKYLFLHNVEKDCYVLPCKDVNEPEENHIKCVEELAGKLMGADITGAVQVSLGEGKIIQKDEYADKQSVETQYVYKLVDLDKIPFSAEKMNSYFEDGLKPQWIDIEKADPEKNGRRQENSDGDFDMAVAEYNGIVEDICKWLGEKMASEMLDGPGMINPAYYTDHQIPLKAVAGETEFMGTGCSLTLNPGKNVTENADSSTIFSEEEWICTCGTKNNGKYCKECGNKKPETVN